MLNQKEKEYYGKMLNNEYVIKEFPDAFYNAIDIELRRTKGPSTAGYTVRPPTRRIYEIIQIFRDNYPDPSGKNDNEPQSVQDAKQRLTKPSNYQRGIGTKLAQDALLPGLATTAEVAGNVMGGLAGLPGDMVNTLAAQQSSQQRNQHGMNTWGMLNGVLSPISNLTRNVLQGTGQAMGDFIRKQSNIARIDSALANETKLMSDVLEAYGSSKNVPTGLMEYLSRVASTRRGLAESQSRYTTSSDERIKNVRRRLSDERCKELAQKLSTSSLEESDADDLASILPEDMQMDFDRYGEFVGDSVLDGYADNIVNYLYTYKPEAQKIDESIDPNQEHIGPMAQDIEKVNPACIVETPEGVKTVDTGRLALMNAGAIADLARELRDLKEGM